MTAEPALQPEGSFVIRDAQGQIQRASDAMPLIFGSREEADRWLDQDKHLEKMG